MRKRDERFEHTSSDIARGAEIEKGSVNLYADLGLVESIRLSNGTRLFKASAVEIVREVYKQRMANRGRRVAKTG